MLGTIRLDSHSAHGARRNEVVGALNNLCGIYSQRAGYFLFSLGSVLPVAFNPQYSYNTMHSLTNWPKGCHLKCHLKCKAYHLIAFIIRSTFNVETGKGKVVKEGDYFVESSALLMESSVHANQNGSMIYSCVRLRSFCRLYPGFEDDKCFRSGEWLEKEIR